MSKAIDLTGQRFGRLKVTRLIGKDKSRNRIWECLCDCGNEVTALASNLKQGCTTSCGCYRKEIQHELSKISMQQMIETQCKENTKLCNLSSNPFKNNTSGVRGVDWVKKQQKWRARIRFKGKEIHLGLFSTLEAAAKARALAEEKYFQPILDKYSTHLKCDLLEEQ